MKSKETRPFIEAVARSRDDAAEWASPDTCYAIDYLHQADPTKYKFGLMVYRVWLVLPTAELRKQWKAA